MATKNAGRFTADERAAMKERANELKRATSEKDLLEKIAEMPATDRAMAKKIHKLVTTTAPELLPKTWYGMPAYAKDDKIICFFQGASKFKARYSTLGFNDAAMLDDGNMWPSSFALVKLTEKEEKKITALVKKAVR